MSSGDLTHQDSPLQSPGDFRRLKPLLIYTRCGVTSNSKTLDCNNNPSPEMILSGCALTHQILMILSAKQRILGGDVLRFEVRSVNLTKGAPDEFREFGLKMLPALVDRNTEDGLDCAPEIVDHLHLNYPTFQLNPPSDMPEEEIWQWHQLCHNVCRKFYFYVNHVTESIDPLKIALMQLDHALMNSGFNYIMCDHLTLLDTKLMPMLHQIRIVLKHLSLGEISSEYQAIWQYLSRAYQSPEFTQWCPSDQEIVINWADKVRAKINRMKLMRESATFSFTVPKTE